MQSTPDDQESLCGNIGATVSLRGSTAVRFAPGKTSALGQNRTY